MSTPRFYYHGQLKVSDVITLKEEIYHRIVNVLRMPVQSEVILFNGQGGEYLGLIEKIKKSELILKITDFATPDKESSIKVHLGQAILKADKMDYVIQKAVELGVTEITPILVKNQVSSLSLQYGHKKNDRWNKIASQACEQSGRNRIVKVNHPQSLETWVEEEADWKGILHTKANPIPGEHLNPQNIRILIGPEGGFLDEELIQAVKNGFMPVRMGKRILRAETASVVILTILQYLWGDLNK